jgi:hypothetical protein
MDFFYNAIRGFFFQMDGVIYGLIDDVYSLLMLITRTSIFGMDEIAKFSERVFALAGIFMLFKVSLSVINYVINPDDFTDKEKGFGNITKKIIFTLVLLVITPFIFQEAYELQSIILEDNTIMHLVFGTPTEDRLPNDNYVESAGKEIQFTVMYAFLQPNFTEFYSGTKYNLAACEMVYQKSSNGLIMRRPGSSYIYALNETCFGVYNSSTDMFECTSDFCKAFSDAEAVSDANAKDIYQTYAQAVAQRNFSLLVRKDLVLIEAENKYLIDYKFLVSTAVGIAVVYILLLFCIDIAVRSIKLGFLEMISPIPILSYIDPKSGKDGLFKKWYQECVKTYMSLFLRLFALYIGIYAITIIGGYTDFITGEVIQGNWLLDVFMIIGILIFAKQLPKMIEELFGVKLDGKFSLNPLKKIEEEAIGGKRLTGAVGGAAAGLASGHLIGGALRGFNANKGFADARKDQLAKNDAFRKAKLDGSTPLGRMGARTSNMLGTGGAEHRIAKEKSKLQDQIDKEKEAKDRIEGEIAPTRTRIKTQGQVQKTADAIKDRMTNKVKEGKGNAGDHYQKLMQEAENARASGGATTLTHNGRTYTGNAEYYKQQAEKWARSDDARQQYADEFMAPGAASRDGALDNLIAQNDAAADVAGVGRIVYSATYAADIDGQSNTAAGIVTSAQTSISGQEQQIQVHDDNIKGFNEELQDVSKREGIAKADKSAIK